MDCYCRKNVAVFGYACILPRKDETAYMGVVINVAMK